MELPKMREQVLTEMAHIPNWPKPQQSFLRSHYWIVRMNSLGKKAEKPGMSATKPFRNALPYCRKSTSTRNSSTTKRSSKPQKRSRASDTRLSSNKSANAQIEEDTEKPQPIQ